MNELSNKKDLVKIHEREISSEHVKVSSISVIVTMYDIMNKCDNVSVFEIVSDENAILVS